MDPIASCAHLLFDLESARLATRIRSEERARRSLAQEADELSCRFAAVSRLPLNPANCEEHLQICNTGALVQYWAGQLRTSVALTRSGIQVLKEYSRVAPIHVVLPKLLHSLTNFARLQAADGNVQGAVDTFKKIRDFVTGSSDLHSHGVSLSRSMAAVLDDDTKSLAKNAYINDSVKAWLSLADYAPLLRFLAQIELEQPNPPVVLRAKLMEVRARALIGVGDEISAIGLLESLISQIASEPLLRSAIPLLYLVISDACAQIGRHEEGRILLDVAENHLSILTISRHDTTERQLRTTSSVYFLAMSFFKVAQFEKCAYHAERVLEMARMMGDEVLELKALMLLVCASAKRQDWLELTQRLQILENLADETGYLLEKMVANYCIAVVLTMQRADGATQRHSIAQRIASGIQTALGRRLSQGVSMPTIKYEGNELSELGPGGTKASISIRRLHKMVTTHWPEKDWQITESSSFSGSLQMPFLIKCNRLDANNATQAKNNPRSIEPA